MRFWPFNRPARYSVPTVASDSLLFVQEALRRDIEDVLVVKESEARGLVVRWSGRLLVEPSQALTTIERRFRPYGFTPFIKRDGDLTWIEALPLANVVAQRRPVLSLVLFLLTVVSTLVAGGLQTGSF